MKLRILYFDIETAPLAARVWSPYQKYISPQQLLHDSFMLTWAAKWDDEDEVMSARLTSKEAIAQDDSRIVKKLSNLVRRADLIVAHNIKRFDLPRLNTRVMLLGQEPLGPTSVIDTLQIAKRDFGLAFNKLDWLAQVMGFGNKIETDMDLWHRCYVGETAALKEMEVYNKHDVVLLQQVFEKMLPHATNVPRLYEADHDDEWKCNYCPATGRENFQLRGERRTQAYTYHTFQCKQCKKYGKTRNRVLGHKAKLTPL